MMEWLSYLLKVSACMALFYALYHLFLRRLSFFSINRFYLLSGLMLSFLIPVLPFQIERQTETSEKLITAESVTLHSHASLTVADRQNSYADHIPYHWTDALLQSYWVMTLVCFSICIYRMIRIARITSKVNHRSGQLKIVYKSTGFTNCSFFNYIFLDNENLSSDELSVILKHESIHVRKFHSIDKVFVQCCQVILWFNPISYLYGKALEQVHEYEADRETSAVVGSTFYASILLAVAVQQKSPALLHSFRKNPVKERIYMLFTNQSKNMKKLTYLLALPMGMGLVALFGVEVVYAKSVTPLSKAVEITSPAILKAREDEKMQTYEKQAVIAKKPVPQIALEPQQDTLRMVGHNMSKNPKVTIDGVEYPADILTKISPRCIASTGSSADAIQINTHNKKIEYATKTDIKNVRTELEAEKSKNAYIRYTLRNEDGGKFDRVKIRSQAGSASLDLPKDGKLLILIGGKVYSEKDAIKLNSVDVEGAMSISSSGDMKNYAEYGSDYQGVIKIEK